MEMHMQFELPKENNIYAKHRPLVAKKMWILSFLAVLFIPCMLAAKSPVLLALEESKKKRAAAQSELQQPSSLLKEPCAGGRFKTDATFLFWQASEDGLAFAASNQPRFPSAINTPTDIAANLVDLDFAWEPAFKILLGYHFANPDWDLNTRWTYFYSKSQRAIQRNLSDAGAGLFPLWIPQQALLTAHPTYGAAKGSLLLHFNTLDFELAYTGGVSKALYLKLHGGLKAILIDQELRVGYADGFSDGFSEQISSSAQAESNCQGLGPRIGFGSKWLFPKGCSIIAEMAASFALSQIDTNREDNAIGAIDGEIQNISIKLYESFWVWRPLLEAKIGFQWSLCFGNNRMFGLEAAYEVQHYWEQNMMTRYADDAVFYAVFNTRSNLILQGLSLTASLGY